ncbi:MAG: carboxymuconolactone decarboxylase family protein [Deltaproteobacteria bacterium]|nr:carboxymuconolactone decarboxylase family protein [Deltaproteobacteria bacterium]
MNNKKYLIALALALVAAPVIAQKVKAKSAEAEATYKDIQATLGSVPEFFKAYPDYAISGAWLEMKSVQLNPKTALSSKQKELIGLGVSAQIPCEYCVYFHTEAAKANGATEDEIKHAIAEASLTRQWSTVLNGLQQDEAAFKAELTKMVDHMKKQEQANKGKPMPPPVVVTDNASFLRDVEKTMGFVPTFIKAVPPEQQVALWNHWKSVEMNPKAPLDMKTTGLIGLAVAAQTPCNYCIIADKEFSRMAGTSDRERYEAIAIAGIVRHWSTFLNGSQFDMQQFRTDTDRVMANLKRSSGRAPEAPGTGAKAKTKTK